MKSTTQKRVRTKVPFSGTLHDFFARTEPPTQQRQSLQSSTSQDVIVIDSDSDDAVEIVEYSGSCSKRRKLSPNNNNRKAQDTLLSHIPIRSSPSHGASNLTFGKPFLLCPNPMENVGHSGGSQALPLLDMAESCPKFYRGLTSDGVDDVLADSTTCSKAEIPSGVPVLNESGEEWNTEFIADDQWSQIPFDEDAEDAEELEVHNTLSPQLRDQPSEKCRDAHATNAFSVLMSSLKEKQAWREADIVEDKSLRTHSTYARRKAPFYKVLQGMPIAVDAFRYGAIPGVTAYFLSHAHSDHYTTLSSSWKNGPIYCSQGTANLIIHMLNVDKQYIRPLPMDTPTLVPDTNGVTVTLIEANHCPGSCLFFFEGPQSVNAGDSNFKSGHVGSSRVFRYLHCGDFRASPQHPLHPTLRGKTVDQVYLDTTYLDPRYTFPPQPLVISACAELARRLMEDETTSRQGPSVLSWLTPVGVIGKEKLPTRTLIVVGTYSIGKERIVKAIAHALKSKVYCDERKAAILRCEADPELDALLTSDANASSVHLIPLQAISIDRLKLYLEKFEGIYDRVIGLRPTGWAYNHSAGADLSPSVAAVLARASEQNFSYSDLQLSPKSTATIQLYSVPYSEHSSFNELTCFALSFSWVKMIATVNVGSESSRAKMAKWVAKWDAERRKRGREIIVQHRHAEYW